MEAAGTGALLKHAQGRGQVMAFQKLAGEKIIGCVLVINLSDGDVIDREEETMLVPVIR
jgi:hypothetical protein